MLLKVFRKYVDVAQRNVIKKISGFNVNGVRMGGERKETRSLIS